MADYYQTLGISKNATKDEIKKAFRGLAHKHHPDKGGGDEKKFKEINEAYQILSDDKKRAEYDAYGRVFNESDGHQRQGWEGFSAQSGPFSWDSGEFSDGFAGDNFGNLGDIFETFFGGANRRRRQTQRGRDIAIDLELSFEEAIFGVERRMLLTKVSFCEECRGSGADKDAKTETCGTCQGSGRIHETRKSFMGAFTSLRECAKCDGKGTVASKKCGMCSGAGVKNKKEEVQIKIPAGIQDGEMIRLAGMGEATAGGTAGDLYVKIHVRSHPYFKREGNNLFMDLNVKVSDALLGCEKEIKTLDGAIILKIPTGISSGEILRVKGKGVPRHGGVRGDLMAKVIIRTPKKISNRAKKLIEELREEGI